VASGSALVTNSTGIETTGSAITVNQYAGCTNSDITLTKGSGSFAFGSMGSPSVVNNLNPTTSSTNTDGSTSPSHIYYTTTGGRALVVGSSVYPGYIDVTTARTLPTINIDGSIAATVEVCINSSITIQVPVGSVGSPTPEVYEWSIVNGTTPSSPSGGTSGQVTSHTFASAGTYYVKLRVYTVCCGWSIPVYRTVTVTTPPTGTASFVSGSGDWNFCPGESALVTVNGISNATNYNWTFPSGTTGTSPTSSNSNTVTFGSTSGQISIQPYNGCGLGSPFQQSVTINAVPSVGISTTPPSSTICIGGSAILTAGVSNGLAPYTYAWSGGPISGLSNQQTVSTTSLVGNQTYIIYITDNRGCEANASQLVTVLPTVVNGTLALGNETVCSGGDPAAITLSTVPSGGAGTFSYQWYFQNGIVTCPTGTSITGWTSIASANSSTYDPPSGLTGSRTYAVQVNATGTPDCGVATWSTGCRQVTVTPLPTVTSSSGAARCGPGTLTLSATASGGVINWYASAVSTTILGTGNAFITPPISLTTTYYAEAFQSGCPSATRTAVVATINTPINSGFITWTGSVNTDWHTVGNWDCGIPTLTDNVLIPGSLTNFPVISAADGNSYTIDLEGNATLNINGTWVLNVSQ